MHPCRPVANPLENDCISSVRTLTLTLAMTPDLAHNAIRASKIPPAFSNITLTLTDVSLASKIPPKSQVAIAGCREMRPIGMTARGRGVA